MSLPVWSKLVPRPWIVDRNAGGPCFRPGEQTFHGIKIPSPASVTWLDEGTPWSVWTVEDVVYNVDVSEYIRAKGP